MRAFDHAFTAREEMEFCNTKPMHTPIDKKKTKHLLALAVTTLLAVGSARAQQTAPRRSETAPTTPTTSTAPVTPVAQPDEEVVVLSPFEVSADSERGYSAATTLAGNRLNTELRDIGNAVTVITSQFLTDIGSTSNATLLQYTTGTEVGSAFGNFAGTGDGAFLNESNRFTNPNSNTRVRGLTSADNTRDFFLTNIPWDSYNVDRVDLQRGPNSILFGQGSPAGIINIGTKQAKFRNSNQVELRYTGEGGKRAVLDINRVLLKDELAFRIIGLYNNDEYKQKPAFALDKRLYSAVRYEPKLLKRGTARTIIKGNIEFGNQTSNQPRNLPPIDRITPWFQTGTYEGRTLAGAAKTYQHLNKLTLNGAQAQDDNTSKPNRGQQRPTYNGGPLAGTPNLFYNPMLGNFGQQFGNPLGYVDGGGNGIISHYWTAEPRFARGINRLGAIDGGIGGMPYQRPLGVASYGDYAKNAGLKYAEFGIYKNKSLTDPSIFDFYNNMYDGPNKKEWRRFRLFNVSLTQTFFDDSVGFDAVYNKEYDRTGNLSLLGGQNQAIYIDIMSVYADGTPLGTGTPTTDINNVTNNPFQDGTPNPNVGRPFLNDISRGSETVSWRENKRITAFLIHDFAKDNNSLWSKILGKHTITGLLGQDRAQSDNRGWLRYTTDTLSLRTFLLGPTSTARFDTNEMMPMPVIYLGPSLLNRTAVQGANIPRVQTQVKVLGGGLRTFDSTWNRPTSPTAAGYVDPAQPWFNDYYPTNSTSGQLTQSENPSNYIGWRDIALPVYDSEDGYRDFNTTGATLQKSTLSSRAVTWQGHFWDNAIVGTYGYREDSAKSWSFSRNTASVGNAADGRLNLNPSVYKLPEPFSNRVDVTSRAYTIVAHLNDLPYLKELTQNWPVMVSLFYNKSTNFQPASQRVDIYGDPLAAPSGRTVDKGVLLETRDGRFSLKLNQYETTATNASSSALSNGGFAGTAQQYGARWANRFEFNWTQDTNAGAVAVNDPTNSQYNYAPAPGETLEQAQAREKAAVDAWRVWQKSIDPKFYAAWRMDITNPALNPGSSQPTGFTVTEDSISEGYEIELSGMPTKNWRLTFNASQTEAQRKNVGGAALTTFVANFEKALKTTAAGDLRIWWGGAGNDTMLKLWNESFGSEWAQRRLQEGTNVPELREWRFNAISNYEFDHGILKNFNFGGGVRYQSDIVIGYRPIPGATAKEISFDLSNPYMGPTETNFDLWVGYHRKVARNIDWRIQLNVRNVGDGNSLIPITVQPDGSAGGYRIAPYQAWSLTNTFNF